MERTDFVPTRKYLGLERSNLLLNQVTLVFLTRDALPCAIPACAQKSLASPTYFLSLTFGLFQPSNLLVQLVHIAYQYSTGKKGSRPLYYLLLVRFQVARYEERMAGQVRELAFWTKYYNLQCLKRINKKTLFQLEGSKKA